MPRDKYDKYDSPNPRRTHTFMSAEDVAAGKKSTWTELEITGKIWLQQERIYVELDFTWLFLWYSYFTYFIEVYLQLKKDIYRPSSIEILIINESMKIVFPWPCFFYLAHIFITLWSYSLLLASKVFNTDNVYITSSLSLILFKIRTNFQILLSIPY